MVFVLHRLKGLEDELYLVASVSLDLLLQGILAIGQGREPQCCTCSQGVAAILRRQNSGDQNRHSDSGGANRGED